MKYEKLCKSILELADNKQMLKELIREFIMLFERTKVVGWNRDDFLDCMIKCKKEVQKK